MQVDIRPYLTALTAVVAAACGASSSPASSAGGDASTPVDATADVPTEAPSLSDASDTGAESASACPSLPAVTAVASTSAPLVVAGDPGSPLGIYDPSLVYPAGAGGGVLSYSTVAPDSVRTRVAVTTDEGATFQYVADANDVSTVSVTTTDPGFCDGGSCSVPGVLWHEVSSVIADPEDTAAPYKLFVHSYVSANGGNTLRRDWGYIGLQTATTPASWSAETKLLGWTSNGTLSTAGVTQSPTQSLSSIPALADCVAFTEPGAFVGPLGIDLALSCAYSPSKGVVKIRVELLRSTDHAASFSYVGPLVGADDFDCLPGSTSQVLGADLFSVDGAEYVVVSPSGPVTNSTEGGYIGCITIPFADAGAGLVARAANGAPAAVSFVAAADGRFAGPCTYAEGATAIGQIVPMQFSPTDLPLFRILRTTIPEP